MKRAYGSEPVLLPTSPIRVKPTAHHQHKHGTLFSVSVRRARIMCAAGLLAVIMVMLVWHSLGVTDNIPATIRRAVSFHVYQPGHLPPGFAIDKQSFTASPQLVAFTVTYQGSKVTFSEQPRPAQFDFANFYANQIANNHTIITPVGAAAVGQFNDSWLASIVTDQTWILVHAPSTVDGAQLSALVGGIRN